MHLAQTLPLIATLFGLVIAPNPGRPKAQATTPIPHFIRNPRHLWIQFAPDTTEDQYLTLRNEFGAKYNNEFGASSITWGNFTVGAPTAGKNWWSKIVSTTVKIANPVALDGLEQWIKTKYPSTGGASGEGPPRVTSIEKKVFPQDTNSIRLVFATTERWVPTRWAGLRVNLRNSFPQLQERSDYIGRPRSSDVPATVTIYYPKGNLDRVGDFAVDRNGNLKAARWELWDGR